MSHAWGTRDVVTPFVCNSCGHSASAVFAVRNSAQSGEKSTSTEATNESDVVRRNRRRAEIEALLIRCPGCGYTDPRRISRYRLHQLNGALAAFVFAAVLTVAGYFLGNVVPSRRIKIWAFFGIISAAMIALLLRNLFRAFVIRPAPVGFLPDVEGVGSVRRFMLMPKYPSLE